MLSEDFALVGTEKRLWNDWYKEEIINREQYKTLFFKYKDVYFQFQPIGYREGENWNGKIVLPDSYVFFSFEIYDKEHYSQSFNKSVCYNSLKEAIDHAIIYKKMTLKDIWDDPNSEYLDFC